MGSRLRVPVSLEVDHIEGSSLDVVTGHAAGAVELVMYGDYEQAASAAMCWQLKRLAKLTDLPWRAVHRHFPTRSHVFAVGAAEAAEAAGAQGRFWEMHAALYANQDALDVESLVAYAADLGLDVDRFALHLVEHRFRAHVENDRAGGMRSGVDAAPALFVDGLRWRGPVIAEVLAAAAEGRVPAHF